MDPDACWEELQDLLTKYKNQRDRLSAEDVQDLITHIEALDGWVCRGGFLPKAWTMGAVPEIVAAKTKIEEGLTKFNEEHPEFPEKRSIEGFYEAVRVLFKARRIR